MLADRITVKYFKYAIGEILLVVIGILIALQINNWNEERKSSIKESNYLGGLQNDLNEQINSIDKQLEFEQFYISTAQQIIEDFNKKNAFNTDESFYAVISNLVSRKTFIIQDATYTDLVSSGNIGLITDDRFRNEVIKYYQELERIDKIIQSNNTFVIDGNFSTIVKKLGYYHYSSDTPLYLAYLENNPSFAEVNQFNRSLVSTSEKLLLIPDNQLALYNELKQRLLIAIAHSRLMHDLRSGAEMLINKLQNARNGNKRDEH